MSAKKGGDPRGWEEIDKTIHEPARLALITQLAVVDAADFVYLVNRTGMSPGNTGAHLKKLERAGYVSAQKGFENNRPQTMYSLTPAGRRALADYRETMLEFLEALGD